MITDIFILACEDRIYLKTHKSPWLNSKGPLDSGFRDLHGTCEFSIMTWAELCRCISNLPLPSIKPSTTLAAAGERFLFSLVFPFLSRWG
ncbi:unnamed protein product, partial [Vitis vinifera]